MKQGLLSHSGILWLRIGLTILIAFSAFRARSQYDQLNFFDLQIDGLTFRNQVNTLFEDSYGFLWIGTNTGLYRYDGNRLKAFQYDVFDPTSIPNNSINSIIEDDHQNLWLGSESYLIRFNRQEETFEGFYKNQTSVCLGKGTDGTIWANLRKVGLAKITPSAKDQGLKFETHFNYTDQGIIQENRVLDAFCEDEFGRHWLGTPTGLYYLDHQHELQLSNFKEAVTTLLPSNNQTFWVSTEKSIYRLEYGQGNGLLTILEHYPIFDETASPHHRILSLLSDRNQQLWIGTSDGLFRGKPQQHRYAFDKVNHYGMTKRGLHKDRVEALKLDRFGNIWIGTHKGVKKLISRSSVFQFNALESLDESLKNEKVISPFLDQHQQLWFGLSSGGFYRLNLQTRQLLKVLDTPRRVNAINYNFERTGLLIGAGTLLFQVGKLDQPQPEIEKIEEYEKIVQDVIQIDRKEIWVGLWGGGLRIINPQQPQAKYKQALLDKAYGNNISVLLLDSKRNVWIGTRGEGLYRVDLKNQNFEHYLPSKGSGLSSNAFLSIFEDRDQTIWMGTRGGGLIKYLATENQFLSYSRQDGLLANTITAIEEDGDQNLWLSTTRGLVRFTREGERILNFTAEDGILESQFAFNSSTATSNGHLLFFGTSGGFYEVHPRAFHQMEIRPKTVITSFNILDHQADQASSFQEQLGGLITDSAAITLPYYQNDLSLEFSSLDLTAPNKNQYAYQLEGVNDNWIVANQHIRNASYYDLAHGQYTFRVKSTNSDGLWNEQATVLTITITPPFWLTWWVYTIYALLMVSTLGLLIYASRNWYQLKKNLLKETVSREKDNQYHRMRMVFFTDISHELRTPLTLIISSVEQLIKGGAKKIKPSTTHRIYNNAVKMKQLINQIMDVRKYSEGEFKLKVSEKDAVADLKMLTATFSDHASLHRIQLKFKAAEPKISSWLDSYIVEKIVSNLLSNALKFTDPGGIIQLLVSKEYLHSTAYPELNLSSGNYLKIIVEDDGIGMTQDDLAHIFNRYYQSSNNLKTHSSGGTGIGMELVHKLVKLHHGAIMVDSEVEKFTRFTVYLPLDMEAYRAQERYLPEQTQRQAQLQLPISAEQGLPGQAKEAIDEQKPDKPQILLVEDNPELRSMMREVLVKNYVILEAEHGGKGFQLALEKQPQIIISDILMPEVDGISLLKQLKNEVTTQHIPVFLLTAKVDDEVKRESIQLGAEDFIEKPFSMDFLEWKVANTLKTQKILEEKYSKVITAAPTEVELESPDERLIQELVQLIEDHLDDPRLSVEFLADKVSMSRANLYRKLQKIIGETPVSFIRKLKLQRAQQILAMNKFYISEVAYMCGFKNQRYFSKCFVKAFGCTPTQFMKEMETAETLEG